MQMYIPAITLTNASLTVSDRSVQRDGYASSGAYPPTFIGDLDTTLTTIIPIDYPVRMTSIPVSDLTHIWRVGDVILKSNVTASTSPGWVNVTPGILSNRSIATGVTTTGSPTITGLSNIYGMEIGSYVTVDIGFPTTGPYKILRRTTTTVTINENANSSQTGVTVANRTAVFKAQPNIAL
jgi:hypothetical protein